MALKSDECNIILNINVGDVFSSFAEADKKIKQETESKFVQYYRRDSRTIEAARNKTKRYLNPELKYACIHGGRQHVPSGKGLRNKRTFRKEVICPANIVLRIADNGNVFSVIKIDNMHNHKVNQSLFNELPHQRKLPPELRESAKKLLSIKANKHLVREQLEQDSQKIIKLKDLSNLQQENKRHYQNNIEAVCKHINEKFGADCHLLIEEDHFRGLIFCTPSMISAMKAYPEMICIDATYRLLNIRAPVYIILIEDGCGESEIVAVGILTREDKSSVKWLLLKFKELNPSWVDIKNVMADKDWTEREVLRECFPDAKILICIFHVFKIFNREVTTEKLKITSAERNLALKILQDMVYATNQNQFDELKLKIERELPQSIVDYFNKNWLNISEEWCPRIGTKILNFMNTTNNRVEGINAKLKSVISLHSSLMDFFDHLLIIIKSLEKEKKSRLAYNLNKRSVHNFTKVSPEYKYSKLVSDYAFKKILLQLKCISKVKFAQTENINIYEVFSTLNSNETYFATFDSCDCFFCSSMGLPCKHIFAIRQHKKMDLFDANLVNQRWTLDYILYHQHLFCNRIIYPNGEANTISETNIHVTATDNPKILNQQEKYKCAFVKGKSIAHLAAEASTKNFQKIMSTLDNLISSLEHNKYDVQIVSPEHMSSIDDNETITVNNQEIQNEKAINPDELLENEILCEAELIDTSLHETCRETGFIGGQNFKIVDTENKYLIENTICDNLNKVDYTIIQLQLVDTENTTTLENGVCDDLSKPNNNNNSQTQLEDPENISEVEATACDNLAKNNDNKMDQYQSEDHSTGSNIFNLVNDSENGENVSPKEAILRDNVIKNSDNLMNRHQPEDVFEENKIVNLADIKMPPVYRKRGRPSGCDVTAIGLPSKRNKKILPFKQLPKQQRIDTILKWILKNSSDVRNRKINKTDLKDRDNIDIRITELSLVLIRRYFNKGVFEIIQNYKTWLSKNGVWTCLSCTKFISTLPSIRCDKCLHWLHIQCVNNDTKENVEMFICCVCRN